MADEKHMLLVAQGGYTDSALSAETWQVGVRLAVVFGTVDPVGTLPNNWDPVALAVNRTETHWTITSNWTVHGPGVSVFSPDDYLNDQAAPAFATWMAGVPFTSSLQLDQLKISPIGTDGHVVPAPPYSHGTPCTLAWTSSYPVGTNGGQVLPLQNSLVASHRTAQVGRHGRGRMFLPSITASALNSAGLIDSSTAPSIATHQAALLEALSYTGSGVGALAVRPIVTGKPWVNYGVINTVRVGNVMDTQRRRRRSIPETYTNHAVTY